MKKNNAQKFYSKRSSNKASYSKGNIIYTDPSDFISFVFCNAWRALEKNFRLMTRKAFNTIML